MMGLSGNGNERTGRAPFTPTQWQELEHQALIYKYMVSGVPVPPELIFSVRRSLDSSLTSRFLPHQPFGWGCFQAGYGRKPDPEPGRCRRTDGKKWRCSREAYPDSKYCEKHMHRGRNRVRKSLENPTTLTSLSFSTSKSSNPLSPNLSSSSSSSSSSSISTSSMDGYSNSSLISANQTSPRFCRSSNSNIHSLNYPYPSSSAKPSDSGLSLHNSSSHHFNILGSATFLQSDKDFRYLHGTLEGVGERTFFPQPEASRSFLDAPYHQPLTGSPYHGKDQRQHCFVMGTDIYDKPSDVPNASKQQQDQEGYEEQPKQQPPQPLHHFFGNDWPQTKNSSDSWLDLSSINSRLDTGS